MSQRLGYEILNVEREKILNTEKLKKNSKLKKKLKTQAQNWRIRHFFAPYMPWTNLAWTNLTWPDLT